MTDQPTKSARKREADQLQRLGARLTQLSVEQRELLPLSTELHAALLEHDRIRSHEAKRRQLQFIGRLMRSENREAIELALADAEQHGARSRYQHHQSERWRERLLESDQALTEYVSAHPDTDRVALRNLIREARRHPERSARTLFRFIRLDQTRHDASFNRQPDDN